MSTQIIFNKITKEIVQSMPIPENQDIRDWSTPETFQITMNGIDPGNENNYGMLITSGEYHTPHARLKFYVNDLGTLSPRIRLDFKSVEELPGKKTFEFTTTGITEEIVLIVDGVRYVLTSKQFTLESAVPVEFNVSSDMNNFYMMPVKIMVD